MSDRRTWREAWTEALYGREGFFHRQEGPAGHFRTSVHASPLFARAIARLASETWEGLGRPDRLDLIDLGAGRGELLVQLEPMVGEHVRLVGVDLAARPEGVSSSIEWLNELPPEVEGLVVANEWLDDIPLDVVEVGLDGSRRIVWVDRDTGVEGLARPIDLESAGWLARWWPLSESEPGTRAEIGSTRDAAWAGVIRRLKRGVAVAVDYSHTFAERAAGEWAMGTLASYRDGRLVRTVPDGSCDVTAHVALDSCAAAGQRAGASATLLARQREVLIALGLDGSLPDARGASANPAAYATALQEAAEAGELMDPDGLGGFGWLVQTVGTELPKPLG